MNTRNGVIKHGEPAEESKKHGRFLIYGGRIVELSMGDFQQTMELITRR